MQRERIIYILVITIILSIPVYLLRDPKDTEYIKNRRYWISKAISEKRYTVVFAGDSRMFRGVSPAAFEKEFPGYNGINFAFWSNGYGRVYLNAIGEKLDRDTGRMIILGITPHSLTPKAARCDHYKSEINRPREEVIQYYNLYRISEYFARVEPLTVADRILKKHRPENFQMVYHPDGWLESYMIVPDTTLANRSYQEIFIENRISEEVIEDLMEYVALWKDKGIIVFAFRPPATYTLTRIENELSGFDEKEFVSRFTDAGGIWLDIPLGAYETYDGSHLEHNSAKRFSTDLARMIGEITGKH